VLRCQDRYRVVNKPRQCGISTLFAAEAAWEVTHVPGAQILVISKDLKAARNFHGYVGNILTSAIKNDPDMPKFGQDNLAETTFPSLGSRIVSLPAGKETGRSFSATHLYLDEMAHQQYADDIFQAAAATLSQTGGRITALSTPKGRANLFARIMEDPVTYDFTAFNFKWYDVPTYNPYYEQYIAADTEKEQEYWIAKAREGKWYKSMRPKYTPLSWGHEFEGSFDADEDQVFSYTQLRRSFQRNWLPEVDDEMGIHQHFFSAPAIAGHYYSVGVDLGRKRDPCVLITYDTSTEPAEVVEFKYIPPGMADWPLVAQSIRQTYEKFNHPEIQLDSTGAGDPLLETLQDVAIGFAFTLVKKNNIIQKVRLAMDNGLLKMPKIQPMYQEHKQYIWDDKLIRQDTVMANALAVDQFFDPESGLANAGVTSFDFVAAAQ
jgi:phage FluMu gp28-like protein